MTIEQLLNLISQGEITKCLGYFEAGCSIGNCWKETARLSPVKEYNPHTHLVTDKAKRQDKQLKDENGQYVDRVEISRIPLPMQKKIVQTAAAFLGTPTLECTTDGKEEENMLETIKKIWEANKLDYKFFSIAEKTMSERHCAELWYTQDVDASYYEDYPIDAKFKLSVKILANSLGDDLYPVFDEYGNMIAFARGYKIIDEDGKQVDHLDIYTDTLIYYTKNMNGAWLYRNKAKEYAATVTGLENPIKKIPVVYYSQDRVEWDDVQALIDRLEKKISNHADTNDYFDSPIVKLKGKVLGFATKGESGKMIEMENGADADYLTYDSVPESMKMEMERLYSDIFKFTNTPDISFEQMKSLGAFSGIAIKMFFVDAHLKAMRKAVLFGEGLQRRINYLKGALAVIAPEIKAGLSANIKPKFEFFMPSNDQETIANLVSLINAKLISLETAVSINPYVSDAVEELARIKKENEAAQAKALEIAQQSKPIPGKLEAV
jgi:SPP1 family phage portal protein